MTVKELKEYVEKHQFDLWCSGCKKWKTSDQETWGPCCYDLRNVIGTLYYVYDLIKELEK